MLEALELFHREPGFSFLLRWAHVVVGVVWIGLLYYFNFVQVPSFAQMEAGARNNAIDKLASRALWWFRWGAVATVLFGIALLIDQTFPLTGDAEIASGDYWKSASGIAIATGVLLGVTMFLNVWGVIWPNQKKVIANARNVQAGGEADPTAAAAGRAAALASRQNTIFSFPMLFFMVGTAHFFPGLYNTGDSGDRVLYYVITLVIWAAFELSALGYIGGRAAGNVTNWVYEDHWRAIGTGLALVVVWYALWEIVF
jgi:uncharacterized membrane protein